jgi:hypothetical protein
LSLSRKYFWSLERKPKSLHGWHGYLPAANNPITRPPICSPYCKLLTELNLTALRREGGHQKEWRNDGLEFGMLAESPQRTCSRKHKSKEQHSYQEFTTPLFIQLGGVSLEARRREERRGEVLFSAVLQPAEPSSDLMTKPVDFSLTSSLLPCQPPLQAFEETSRIWDVPILFRRKISTYNFSFHLFHQFASQTISDRVALMSSDRNSTIFDNIVGQEPQFLLLSHLYSLACATLQKFQYLRLYTCYSLVEVLFLCLSLI